MPTSSLIAVAAGILAALCYASVITGALVAVAVAYIAPLPLLLVALSDGPRGGAIAAAVATALLAMLGNPMTGLVFFATEGLPVVLLAGLALTSRGQGPTARWPGAGPMVALLTLYAVAIVLVTAAATAILGRGLEAEAQAVIRAMMAAFTPPGAPTPPPLGQGGLAILIAGIAASWLAMLMVNAILAQRVLVRTGRNRRPSPTFTQVWLPEWMAIAFVVSVVVGWVLPGTLGFLGHVVALVLCTAYGLVGLALVHVLSWRVKNRRITLVGFYLTLLLLPFLGLILALIGFIEPWLRLRQRFGPGATGGGHAGHST